MYTSTSITKQHQTFKRVKERLVCEAIEKVEQWRTMFTDGIKASDGQIYRVTLNKAAEIVGIPKKTLEDYTQLFKKISLLTDVKQFSNEKMGYLRSFLRKNQNKLKKIMKEIRIKEIEAQKKAEELIEEQKRLLLQSQCEDHDDSTDICQSSQENSIQQQIKQNNQSESSSNTELQLELNFLQDDEKCQNFSFYQEENLDFHDYESHQCFFDNNQKMQQEDDLDQYFQSANEFL